MLDGYRLYVSGLYTVVALNLILVPMLFSRKQENKWQTLLGGLSYPIFLSHWLIGSIVAIWVPTIAKGGSMYFIITTVGTLIFSFLLYFGVDRPVQRVRIFIKKAPAFGGWVAHDLNPRRNEDSISRSGPTSQCGKEQQR
jgi:peptidoglycan/LPS O-acetylase OafA/YrhL